MRDVHDRTSEPRRPLPRALAGVAPSGSRNAPYAPAFRDGYPDAVLYVLSRGSAGRGTATKRAPLHETVSGPRIVISLEFEP